MDFIEKSPPGRALDLGCGTGTNVLTLAKHGWEVVGIDFAWPAVRRARQKALQAQVDVTLKVGDAIKLEGISGPFDLLLDIGCFHNLSDGGHWDYLKNLERLLAPGGVFLLYTFIARDQDGKGVSEATLRRIGERLELVWRQDGSERGRRPSAWLMFRQPILPDSHQEQAA
jgi:cyclopropane fatty-acyl-phospholipid synthase-like methyltransferase